MATPDVSDATPSQRRPAKAHERAIAGTLIAGAFGLIGLALFAWASALDKVQEWALKLGFWLTVGAALFLLASIIFGGKGMAGSVKPGFRNPFNLQAWSGLIGFLFLLAAGGVFALNLKDPKPALQPEALEARIHRLEENLAKQNERLDREIEQRPCAIAMPTTGTRPTARRSCSR